METDTTASATTNPAAFMSRKQKRMFQDGVPADFTYCVRVGEADNIFGHVRRYYAEYVMRIAHIDAPGLPVGDEMCDRAYPVTGEWRVGAHRMWVVEKGGASHLYFEDRSKYRAFVEDLEAKHQAAQPPPPIYGPNLRIYHFQRGAWRHTVTVENPGDYRLVGYDGYVEDVIRKIKAKQRFAPLLRSMGETICLNILLVGVPGTGKTTMIKTVSSRLQLPVFIGDSATIRGGSGDSGWVSTILNPTTGGKETAALLFEDLDRYLIRTGDTLDMSTFLNALSGIESSGPVVRFFTANSLDVIQANEALYQRMNGVYYFGYPERSSFEAKARGLFERCEVAMPSDESLAQLLDAVMCVEGVTLRPFTSFLLDYILDALETGTGGNEVITKALSEIDKLRAIVSFHAAEVQKKQEEPEKPEKKL